MALTKQQLVKEIKNSQWFVQGFNGLPLYLHSVASNTGWMTKPVVGANYSHFFLRVQKSRAHWYYNETDMAKIGGGYFKKIKTINQLRNLEKIHLHNFNKAKRSAGKITTKLLEHLSFKDLCKLAEKMVTELTMSVGIAHVQEGVSFVSEMRLKQILDKRGENRHENYQTLSSPIEPSFLLESQVLLTQIKSAKGAKRKSLIIKFISDFGWIDNTYVRGKLLTQPEVEQKAKDQKHHASLKQLQSIKQKKQKLIKQLNLSAEELFTVRTIEICTKWQDTRKKFIMQTIGRFEPVVEELALRLATLPDALKYSTPHEFNYKHLSSDKFIESLNSRYPQCAYYTTSEGIFSYPGKDYLFIEKAVVSKESGDVTELKGSIANKGIARGPVRVIKSIHDILKVEKGEILVAYMTRPEFLPAMQKAAAFVTNEGGITLHAAIVSREMNKPCIIGTKIATEVLHDGQMVEVNANLGIVKIL